MRLSDRWSDDWQVPCSWYQCQGRGSEVGRGSVWHPGLEPPARLVAAARCTGLSFSGPRAGQAARGDALPSDPTACRMFLR